MIYPPSNKIKLLLNAVIGLVFLSSSSVLADTSWWVDQQTRPVEVNAEGRETDGLGGNKPSSSKFGSTGWWNSDPAIIAGEGLTSAVQEGNTQAGKYSKKHFSAGQMTKIVGKNRQTKKQLARKVNSTITYLNADFAVGAKKVIGVIATVLDIGSGAAGHAIEGNYPGAGAAIVDESAEALSAYGGASALGSTGAAAGLAVGGPVGGLIGGVAGAIAGAAAGSMGYKIVVGDELFKFAEYVLTSSEEGTPLTAADRRRWAAYEKRWKREAEERAEREAWYKKKRDEAIAQAWKDHDQRQDDAKEQMKKIGWESSIENEALIVGSSISLPENFFEDQERLEKEKVEKPKKQVRYTVPDAVRRKPAKKKNKKEAIKELKKKAEQMTSQADSFPEGGYDSTPVIPANCIIDFVIWDPSNPEHKADYTLEVRGGEIYARNGLTQPDFDNSDDSTQNYCSGGVYEYITRGTLDGNIITSATTGETITPMRCTRTGTRWESREGSDSVEVPYTCNSVHGISSKSTEMISLNIDATVTETMTIRSFPTYSVSGPNCPQKTSDTISAWEKSNVSAPSTSTFIGLWKIRK